MYIHTYYGNTKTKRLIRKVDCFLAVKDSSIRNQLLFLDAGNLDPLNAFNAAESKLADLEIAVMSNPDAVEDKGKFKEFIKSLKIKLKKCRNDVKENADKAFNDIKTYCDKFSNYLSNKDVKGKLKSFVGGVKTACSITADIMKKVSALVTNAHKVVVSLNSIHSAYKGIDRKELGDVTKDAIKKLNSSSKEWLKNAKKGKAETYKKVSKSIDFLLISASNEELNKKVAEFLDLSSNIIGMQPVTTKKEAAEIQDKRQEVINEAHKSEALMNKNKTENNEPEVINESSGEISEKRKKEIEFATRAQVEKVISLVYSNITSVFNYFVDGLKQLAGEFGNNYKRYLNSKEVSFDLPIKGRFNSNEERRVIREAYDQFSQVLSENYSEKKIDELLDSFLDSEAKSGHYTEAEEDLPIILELKSKALKKIMNTIAKFNPNNYGGYLYEHIGLGTVSLDG